MNAKTSLIWFGVGALWLAGLVWTFAHAAQTVEGNLTNGLIWFAVSILWGCLGVFGGVKLNKKR